jgi:hypothetical protein
MPLQWVVSTYPQQPVGLAVKVAQGSLAPLPGNAELQLGASIPQSPTGSWEPVELWMNRPQKRDNGTTFPQIFVK